MRDAPAGLPLQVKLPVALTGLLVLVIGGLGWAAYGAMRRSAFTTADQRLESVTTQVAALLQAGNVQRTTAMRAAAAYPELRAALLSPGSTTRAAASAALEHLLARDTLRVSMQLLDTAGTPVVVAGRSTPSADTSVVGAFRDVIPTPDGAALGPFRPLDGGLAYSVAAAVAADGVRRGYVVAWQRVTATPQAARQFAQLIGPDAALLIGDVTGVTWTDLSTVVDGPPVDVASRSGLLEYQRPRGAYLARVAGVAGTPWLVVIEFPRDRVLGPVQAFQSRFAATALVVLAAAAAGSWWFTRRLTRPLAQITDAAAAAAAGGPLVSVPVHRTDEIGRLAGAFNIMARRVEERERAEARFRAAVEAAPVGAIMVDADGTIVLVNVQIERMFGYPRDHLLGQPIELLVPAASRAKHPEFRTQYVAHPQTRAMGAGRDLYGVRRDGTQFPVEIGLNPLEMPEGLRVLATVVDISARKRVETRLRVVVESSPNGIVMVDGQGTIVLVNRETERLFGYDREELLGQPIELLADPHDC